MMKFVLILFIGFNSWAGGTSIDGGGGGVTVNNKTYLLDFYEAGIHNSPFIEAKSSGVVQNLLREHRRDFDAISDETLALVFGKIQDVAAVDPVLAAFIEKSLISIQWNFSIQEVLGTEDTNVCVFNLKSEQLAIRQGNLVSINLTKFSQMDSFNQAGLLIHEALQSLAPDTPKDICRHRRAVASLFTKSFLRSQMNFWNQTLKAYPTAHEVLKLYPQLISLQSNDGYFYSRKGLSSPLWGGLPASEEGILDETNLKTIDIMNWLLFPHVEIIFSNGRVISGESVLKTPQADQLCSEKNIFNRLSIKYWRAELTPRFNENGEALAQFDWSLKQDLFTTWLKGSPYEPLAPCESLDYQYLNNFDLWKNTLTYFRTN